VLWLETLVRKAVEGRFFREGSWSGPSRSAAEAETRLVECWRCSCSLFKGGEDNSAAGFFVFGSSVLLLNKDFAIQWIKKQSRSTMVVMARISGWCSENGCVDGAW
jgi:hypothetical protein